MSRIVVIANNEAGVIADIAGALAECNINIETISAESIGENGAITLTADDHDGALRVLTDAGFKTISDESLVLRLRDEPGALARLAEKFKQAGVNIRSLHILDRRNGHATVAISADDRAKAEALVKPLTAVQGERHEA